ncbi:MAG: PaaI family thioesterase [Actinomycetota bacterium]
MKSDNLLQELKAVMTEAVPYWRTLGLELKEVAPGRAVFEAQVRPDLMQHAVVHGGVLASIADSACAVAGVSHVFPENYATTINLQLAYLKPLLEGRFRAEGHCVKAGKMILFCEAVVFDHKESVVCRATSQLMVIPWRR